MLAAFTTRISGMLRHWFSFFLVVGFLLSTTACRPINLQDAQRIAAFSNWTGHNRVNLRERKRHVSWENAKLLFGIGPEISEQATLYLKRYDVTPTLGRTKLDALQQLQVLAESEPSLDKEFTLSELALIEARAAQNMGRAEKSKLWYLNSVYHAYRYLFSPQFNHYRNAYSPEFRMTVDYYNRSLEGLLRILNKEDGLKPNVVRILNIEQWHVTFQIQLKGPWAEEDFEKFEFSSDYEVTGVGNQYRTEGLGVPLIAVRTRSLNQSPADKYYPDGLTIPITAFLRFNDGSTSYTNSDITEGSKKIECLIEFQDSLKNLNVQVNGRPAPLQSDLTTPLGYFLQNSPASHRLMETVGLLDSKLVDKFSGLYMLEPYDPKRVPVLLVHGFWSGPFTWLEMFNELRALPEIREQYQFWFYVYPTGQPFWISAKEMRNDLEIVRNDIDPERKISTLDHMVLVGHSMGGLVSRLQTVNSGESFWKILSDQPFENLQADPAFKEEIRDVLFFEANPSIKRVITIGTPHRGSRFANSFTRWLSHRIFRLPDLINGSRLKQIDNADEIFKNKEILTTKTSLDSLSSESPFLAELVESGSAPWVRTHNIVGNFEKRPYLGVFGKAQPTAGDGIVTTENARFEEAISQIQVNARHQDIQSHARAILEVRRILREHGQDVRTALLPDEGSPGVKHASFTIDDLPSTEKPEVKAGYRAPIQPVEIPIPDFSNSSGDRQRTIPSGWQPF